MKQIDRTINAYSWIMPIILSVFGYVLLFSIIQCGIGYIPIKLVYTDMYIPIYYWLALIGYTYLYSVSNKIKFSDLFLNMFVLGIFLHIYIMLLQLNQFLLNKPYYERMYLWYAFMIETGLFALSSYLLYHKFRLNRLFHNPQSPLSAEIKKEIYLYFPLTINIFYHLYRDIKQINLLYFCFHLAILAVIYVLSKKKFYFQGFKKEAILSFIRREETVIILIFLFSFFVRVIFAFHIIHVTGDRFPTASDDGPTYNHYAILIMQSITNLISGNKIIPTPYDPGYSIFLGFIYKIFGYNFYVATLIQSLLNALMVTAIYLIARNIFNRKIGLVAAMLTALNQPLIMLSVVLTTEALYTPLLVFSIYCLMKYSKNMDTVRRKYWLLAGGFIMGFAIITRAMLLLFPGMVICWLLLYERGFKWMKSGMILIVGLIPALSLITILTYANTGEVKIFTTKQDSNWTAFADKEGSRYIDPRHIYSNAKLIEMGINPFKDFKGSLSIIMKNPLKVLKIESEILPIRLKLFLFYPNFGFFDPIFILTSTTPNQYASTVEFYALLILTVGMVNVLIKRVMVYRTSLLMLLIIYYLIIHVGLTTGQCSRYRVPINPFFMIFAANGLYLIFKIVVDDYFVEKAKKC